MLEQLVTWDKNFQELLNEGNHDSSDMQGLGYLVSENGRVYSDNVFDYDSWEYFEGKLEGYERILKTISSLMKNEIGIDLLLNAYEVIKSDYNKESLHWYTDEELELVGFSKDDIENIKNR